MHDLVSVTGMVIRTSALGEADKRLVLLTKERGKITAFARGAKRPGSPLMAPSRLFAFGVFRLFEGREAYSLQGAEISNYFEEIGLDVEAACYGSYFLELADYHSQEGLDGTELLKLVYQSLRALLKPAIPRPLVRRIFELKTLVVNGEYTERPGRPVSQAAAYAWEYVVTSPIERLYRFTLKEEVLEEFAACVEEGMERSVGRKFRSLAILEAML